MVNFGPLAAEIGPLFWAPLQISVGSHLGSVTARHSSSGRQPNFAALNRGRHLYLAGRLSRWALAHISSFYCFIDKWRYLWNDTRRQHCCNIRRLIRNRMASTPLTLTDLLNPTPCTLTRICFHRNWKAYMACHYFTASMGAKCCNEHVCLSVCLFACISQKPHVRTSQNVLYVLPVAVSQSSSVDSGTHYVLWFFRGWRHILVQLVIWQMVLAVTTLAPCWSKLSKFPIAPRCLTFSPYANGALVWSVMSTIV